MNIILTAMSVAQTRQLNAQIALMKKAELQR
jgi:hypothetical protein